jgi:hypothetical protein
MTRRRQPSKTDAGIALNCDAERTQEEVAAIMTARGYPMKRAAVYEIERRALRKIRDGLLEAGYKPRCLTK